MVTDILDRQLEVEDYVVFHNLIYQVLNIPTRGNMVKIILLDKAKITRPVTKNSKEMCLLPPGDVIFYLLKRN